MKLTLKVEMEVSGDVEKAYQLNSKIENFLTDLEPLEIVKSLTWEHNINCSMAKFKMPPPAPKTEKPVEKRYHGN